MSLKHLFAAISLILLSMLATRPAFAVTAPDFGSCLNPQGKAVASYDNGRHGIVGRTDEVEGSDYVYESGDNALQCFCPENGSGIQTNWYNASKLTQEDIDVMKKDGWAYFATGSSWGLKDVPYLAKNVDYTCKKTAEKGASVTSVLRLASTGDTQTIYTFILSGAAFLISGLVLRKFSR